MMKQVTSPRTVSFWALTAISENGAWSDGALHEALSKNPLSRRDAALATRITYGTLQNQMLCDFYLRSFSSIRLKKIDKRVLICLRMAVYQLLMMDKIPAHAAVSETVSLVRQYCKANERTVSFVNGVLRSINKAKEENTLPVLNLPDKESYYALKYSHPEWLVRLLSAQYGQKETEKICRENNADVPISVRVNLMKATTDEMKNELEQDGISVVSHAGFSEILLCSGGDVSKTDAFLQGKITVQDAASTLAAAALNPSENSMVLDCCAAPGGKSFLIAEKMKNTGQVFSCDIYEHKLAKISEGAKRLGLTSIKPILQNAAENRAEWNGKADYVLCDVPCSGMGIIRKKPEIRYKDEEEIKSLPEIQLNILRNAANYVKKGGTLVYSTCTILERENEAVVRAFLKENTAFETMAFSHPACGDVENGMITLLPHIHGTDGFFVAKLRKK